MTAINWIVIGVGVLMLTGSFATVSSANTSTFDHDFALILLIAGVITLLYGTNIIDPEMLKSILKPTADTQ